MFRFTIRDLLWLTVASALCAALWVEHSKLGTVRNHARVLRSNLELARWWYAHIKPHHGASTERSAVDWAMIEKPIP